MKALVLMLPCMLAVFASGCTQPQPEDDGTLDAAVSILPQKYFVERVAGQHAGVFVMVGPGESPATYEPTPRQMARLGRAEVYFRVGVPFEESFVPQIRSMFDTLRIVDTRKGIELREMDDGHEGDDHDHDHGARDPHTWMDPDLVKIQARNISDALQEIDPDNAADYQQNLERFQQELDALDARIAEILEPLKGREIFVFHPSYGYFADAYGLKQVPVEVGGKEPSARQLSQLIDKAKRRNVKVIFVQKQFSDKAARAIAEAIGGAVVQVDPLAYDYIENMERIARDIRMGLQSEAE